MVTPAKTKQAVRTIEAGTPLIELAEVLGVPRTTLYPAPQDHTAHCGGGGGRGAGLSGGVGGGAAVGAGVPLVRARTGHPGGGDACARRSCGLVAAPRPGPSRCRGRDRDWVCQPSGAVVNVECTRCEEDHQRRFSGPGQRTRVGGLPRTPLARYRRVGDRPRAGVQRTLITAPAMTCATRCANTATQPWGWGGVRTG